MPKFQVQVVHNSYRIGYYDIEAPDKDGAYSLAQDIAFNNPRHPIEWEDWIHDDSNSPRAVNIFVEEK